MLLGILMVSEWSWNYFRYYSSDNFNNLFVYVLWEQDWGMQQRKEQAHHLIEQTREIMTGGFFFRVSASSTVIFFDTYGIKRACTVARNDALGDPG
jgi:hypothetical protein